ncbi:MAG: ATP-binding protein [Bacteroidaceae bacterium]|nr:ATP-binding protein [Bacteroidaceae bacterium]
MIERSLKEIITQHIGTKKAIIIMGPRQVGKSTLLHSIFDKEKEALWLDADDMSVASLFENASSERIKAIIGNHKYLIIDEAQCLKNAGLTLKIINDYIPDTQLIATGSSSFELADKLKEALTGRKWEYRLYPISFAEMVNDSNFVKENAMLEHRLVYGYYPEPLTSPGNEREILSMLANDYLYKDIMKLESMKKTGHLVRLLKALALQIGSLVSYNELAQTCGLDSKTVEKYIDVLEQCYVVFRLGSFSRNIRNELKKSRKVYFYDLGIRNAILNNFTPIENRSGNEIGAMWENFLIAEKIKINEYNRHLCNKYFWRTKQQQEIDYIEEYDGMLNTYEFKWKAAKDTSPLDKFMEAYPNSKHVVVNRDNYHEFLMEKG